jgi:hypothetical protein
MLTRTSRYLPHLFHRRHIKRYSVPRTRSVRHDYIPGRVHTPSANQCKLKPLWRIGELNEISSQLGYKPCSPITQNGLDNVIGDSPPF